MVVHIHTLTFQGIEFVDVDVQVHMSSGIPSFTIVGLLDKTVAESRERVRAALHSLGLSLPPKRITINLSPADLAKEGSHFDLAIACGLLAHMDILPADELNHYIIMGELSLDGSMTGVRGVLPAAIGANARDKGLICPAINAQEALWSGNQGILAPENIITLINHFKGTQVLTLPESKSTQLTPTYPDLSDVRGQETAKRALEVAAAGSHNLLMSGPPGAGKSMLASRLPGLLPPLAPQEMLECSMIASISGMLEDGQLLQQRPFRAPHHSCSMAAMVGGGIGKRTNPGEISLAHHGVLFLDELPEFARPVLESLRQPIETGEVTIARAHSHITYPASFQLVAAMNPCRCGYLGDPGRACNKAPLCGEQYQSKISGPLFDRMDIFLDIPPVSALDIQNSGPSEPSKVVAARVLKARITQLERYDGYGIRTNSEASGNVLLEYALPDDDGKELLNQAVEKMKLSMRGYDRILRVGRTIADLEGNQRVRKHHVAEAISYRQYQYAASFAASA